MHKTLSATLLIAVGAVLGIAHAQEWEYRSYNAAGKPALPGVLKLIDAGAGKYKVRLLFANQDSCFRADLDATVVVEKDIQLITAAPLMRGCPEVRFAIKTDGSGGQRQLRRADGTWAWDKTERGLQRKP